MSNFKNLNDSEKPREKLKTRGLEALSDSELIAIQLGSGTKDISVTSLATILIEKYGSLGQLLMQSPSELMTNHGIGLAKATNISSIYEIIKRVNGLQLADYKYIKSSEDVYNLLHIYASKEQENFIVINLNTRGKVINYKSIYTGTIDQMTIHPREIFNFAISNMAKSIILCHNHPSGNINPSKNDIKSTKKLIEVSDMIGIKIIDHVIITANEYYSMREKCDIIFI